MHATRLLQADLVALQRAIKAKVKEFGAYLDDTFRLNWDSTFPGVQVEFIPGVDGGCMTDRWEPELYVYSINGIKPTEIGEWVDAQNHKVSAPVKLTDLQDFFLKFLTITQVPVKLAYTHPRIEEDDRW